MLLLPQFRTFENWMFFSSYFAFRWSVPCNYSLVSFLAKFVTIHSKTQRRVYHNALYSCQLTITLNARNKETNKFRICMCISLKKKRLRVRVVISITIENLFKWKRRKKKRKTIFKYTQNISNISESFEYMEKPKQSNRISMRIVGFFSTCGSHHNCCRCFFISSLNILCWRFEHGKIISLHYRTIPTTVFPCRFNENIFSENKHQEINSNSG